MGAISTSEPIFTKLNTHHYKLNSVRYAKFRANRKIYRDIGAPFTLNRTKLYVGAISKSEPIFSKLGTHRSAPNSVLYAIFHTNRRIQRDFGAPFTLNRTNLYMGAISKSEPIFSKLNTRHSTQYSMPNFVQIEGYIGTLVILLP